MAYVSLRTIATKAGVSVSAVSLALRNQPGISRLVAQKIQAVAQELGYQPPALLHEAMGQLRQKLQSRFNSHLAVCSDGYYSDGASFRVPQWKALEKRAANIGYSLEFFPVAKLSARALRSGLRNRNIRGILLDLRSWLRPDLEFLMEDFSCVLLGPARRLGLPVHFVETDQFQAGKKALEKVVARGYRRIGLVRNFRLDPEGTYRAGICSMNSKTLPLTICEFDPSKPMNKESILDWFVTESPECILTTHSEVRHWLQEAGYRFPQDVGLVHLIKTQGNLRDWSGMDPLEEEVDAAGLNKLISMLRQGESGIPRVQECIQIEGVWSEGTTLRPPRNRLIYDSQPPLLASFGAEPAKLRCLNLRPYVNCSFSLPGGWFGDEALQHCVPGEHEICGTRFQVLDETVDGKSALIMRSRRCLGEEAPNPVKVDIEIGLRVKAIHLLHACGWSGGDVRNFASYELIDAQGRGKTIALIDRRTLSGPESDGNIQDYWPKLPPLASSDVRPVHLTAYGNSDFYSAYLYILEWINPNPRKIIQTLRVTSNPEAQTTLGLIGVTVQI